MLRTGQSHLSDDSHLSLSLIQGQHGVLSGLIPVVALVFCSFVGGYLHTRLPAVSAVCPGQRHPGSEKSFIQ